MAFDAAAMDFVISDRPRRGEGKGVRAILYSAFVIGLMQVCEDEGRPHPGFVVIDSPLTTYRGPTPAGRDPEDVPPDVEAAFFNNLADGAGRDGGWGQVIIFDNKEPPAEVRARINYIEFTGQDGAGRAGFIPTPWAANSATSDSA